MMTAGFSKAKGKQEGGAHQPPSLGGIPPGPFPLHPCLKLGNESLLHKVRAFLKGQLLG